LIQTGSLCKSCADAKKLATELQQEKAKREKLEKDLEKIQEFINRGGLELLKK
jgi:hypothetical protein